MRRFIRKLFAKSVSGPVTTSRKSNRAQLALEGLETRAVMSIATPVLSGSVLTINGSSGNDVIEIRAANANSVEVLENGVTRASFPFSVPVLSRIDVDGLAGSDRLIVTSLPALVNNGRLNVKGVESVELGKNISTTSVPKFSLAEVRSEVFVNNPLNLNIRGDGETAGKFVNVSSTSVTGLAPRAVSYSFGTNANLDIRTGDGADTININSTMTGGRVRVFSNGGADTINVAANDAEVRVSAGNGNDTLNVAPALGSLSPINARIDFFGEADRDAVNVNDRNQGVLGALFPTTYSATVTGDQITRSLDSGFGLFRLRDEATINYGTVESVAFSASETPMASGSLIRVTGTSPATVINAGAQDVLVGNAGKLDGIRGALTVNRSTAGGTLTIDDSTQTQSMRYTLGANSVSKSGVTVLSPITIGGRTINGPALLIPAVTINFNDNVSNVRVQGGTAGDNFNVTALRGAGARYAIDGGGGLDTLTAPNLDNTFVLTGANAGSLDNTITYSNVENLIGNARDDKFIFGSSGSLTGSLDGAGGKFDTLDYSPLGVAVNVNLATGSATRVGPSLSTRRVNGIENVFGGQGSDTIIGNSASNVLSGNGGNDIINGNGGADLLIGGNDIDDLSNRTGTAIFIGGRVKGALATDAGLKAVMAEWSRTDLPGTAEQQFVRKATDLKLGTGLNGSTRLDLTTLEADGQADQLDPNPLASAFDLFVIDLQDQFKSAANLPSNVENQQKIVV